MFNPYYAAGGLILAQAASPPVVEWWGPLVQGGIPGAVLLWFMLRGEKKLDEQTRAQREMAQALNSNAKSNIIVVLALKNLDSNITSLAQQLEDEIQKNEADANVTR